MVNQYFIDMVYAPGPLLSSQEYKATQNSKEYPKSIREGKIVFTNMTGTINM